MHMWASPWERESPTGESKKCERVSKCLLLNYHSPCSLEHGSVWLVTDLWTPTHTRTRTHTIVKCNSHWIQGLWCSCFSRTALFSSLHLCVWGEERADVERSWQLRLIELFALLPGEKERGKKKKKHTRGHGKLCVCLCRRARERGDTHWEIKGDTQGYK